MAWRRVCAAQVAPLQHCSTAAGQTWPGLGRVEFHHCTVWTLPDTGHTPRRRSPAQSLKIKELKYFKSLSVAVVSTAGRARVVRQ